MNITNEVINRLTKKIYLAKLRLLSNYGFFGSLLIGMNFVLVTEDNLFKNSTGAATDGKTIYFKPEELEAYKDWVDDVYSDVETPSAPSAPGEDGGQGGGGGTASGGGTSDGGAGDGGSRFISGAHTTSGKDVEEEIKQIIDDVLNSSTNSDGYKDEDHYRAHVAALAEDSDRSDFYSLEGFYR